jgi:regulatory protein
VVKSVSSAIAYLSRFARTEFQVRRYLQRKGYSSAEISEAIEFLQEHKFLNDQAFAESYIRSRIARLDGPAKIQQLLMQKGVASSRAKTLIQENYPEELQVENAKKLMKKRHKRSREQLKRFVASRGYSGYVIMQAFKSAE